MKFIKLFVLVFIAFSCGGNRDYQPTIIQKENKALKANTDDLNPIVRKETEHGKIHDSVAKIYNLVDIQTINSNIKVDLKYATEDNFMKQKVYKKLNKALLQKDVAERLSKCQDYLSNINPDLHLLVYDAVRPVEVQWRMWRALDSIPSKERGRFVSNPINKSVHNYGAAVDITICDKNGIALDMGAEFDEFNKIAYPSMEDYFLSSGELTEVQIGNRTLLRKVMKSQGFRNLPSEWWHFNACSRLEASTKYKLLEIEP